jgi:hypothetical protein
MGKSTYLAKSLVWTNIRAALLAALPRAWNEGQPPKQVLDDLQREIERLVAPTLKK